MEGRNPSQGISHQSGSRHNCLTGYLTDPRTIGEYKDIEMPEEFLINDNSIIPPAEKGDEVEVVRGPNIKPFPINTLCRTGKRGCTPEDGGQYYNGSYYALQRKAAAIGPTFPICRITALFVDRIPQEGKGSRRRVPGSGHNYGQGSSREHAALVPLYLGVKGVIAKSFARIHMANLVNSGILPLTFANEEDYEGIDQGDELVLEDAVTKVKAGERFVIRNVTKGKDIEVVLALSERLKNIILAGGMLNYVKQNAQ